MTLSLSLFSWTLLILGLSGSNEGLAGSDPMLDLKVKHAAVGRAMDTYYYEAGTRVDTAGFDLNELSRQGGKIPAGVLDEIEAENREMRRRWIELDKRRTEIYTSLCRLPPDGQYMLTIENLEDMPGTDEGWFGFRAVSLVFSNAAALDIPLRSFRNGAFHPKYSYLCERSPTEFVFNRQSTQYQTTAGFDVKDLPPGDAKLIISGLDCDKPGVTKIRIEINNLPVFEGENPFQKQGWSEHAFRVSAEALRKVVPRGQDRENAAGKLQQLGDDVERFRSWATGRADRLDEKTAALRKDLKFKPLAYPHDNWQKHFLRGMCFQSNTDRKTAYYDNWEYAIKAMREAGVDLVCAGINGDYAQVFAKFDEAGLPYLTDWVRPNPTCCRQAKYFYDRPQLLKDTDDYIRRYGQGHSSYAGFLVDEPYLKDGTNAPIFSEQPETRQGFGAYLEKRRDYLGKAGIAVPTNPAPVTAMRTPAEQPLWMEWQLYKKQLMGEHYTWFCNEYYKRGVLVLPCIMNWTAYQPQGCSYVSMSEVPLISSDLYHNGTVTEAFAMQLLHHAAKGKAVMIPGAGYSCRTPDAFRRSLAVSMVHADGVLQWIYVYCSKYRNPATYWRTEGKRANLDDRGRDALSNWRPEYWDIQVDMFKKMAAADDYLTDAESIADIVVLHSERTAIADSSRMSIPYTKDNVLLYSVMADQHRSVDAAFIERMTPERMKRYKVALLADARALTPAEIQLVRDWVNAGGTLIATADTSLADEWGRRQKDFALADILGAHDMGAAAGAGKFSFAGLDIEFSNTNNAYRRVATDGAAKVRACWNTGDPALIENKAGQGRAWFFTGKIAQRAVKKDSKQFAPAQNARSGMVALLAKLTGEAAGVPPAVILNAPEGLEVQIRKKADYYMVHLLDWRDERDLASLALRINLPGNWEMERPFAHEKIAIAPGTKEVKLSPVHIYDLIVLKPLKP